MTNRRLLTVMVVTALSGSVWFPVPSPAQSPTAEVRTWSGRELVVSEPALDALYTILIEKEQGGAAPAGQAVSPGASLELSGSVRALTTFLEPNIISRWGRRPVHEVTVVKDGIETRIPLGTIRTLMFTRELITRNTLPTYHAPKHFRRVVTAVLQDGSSIEGHYVNLGTTLLTGVTPQGRIEIPWEEIELVRFGNR